MESWLSLRLRDVNSTAFDNTPIGTFVMELCSIDRDWEEEGRKEREVNISLQSMITTLEKQVMLPATLPDIESETCCKDILFAKIN